MRRTAIHCYIVRQVFSRRASSICTRRLTQTSSSKRSRLHTPAQHCSSDKHHSVRLYFYEYTTPTAYRNLVSCTLDATLSSPLLQLTISTTIGLKLFSVFLSRFEHGTHTSLSRQSTDQNGVFWTLQILAIKSFQTIFRQHRDKRFSLMRSMLQFRGLSVTFIYCAQTVEDTDTISFVCDRTMSLPDHVKIWLTSSNPFLSKLCPSVTQPMLIWESDTIDDKLRPNG